MRSPIIDMTATLILLIAILTAGYFYADNQEKLRNQPQQKVVVKKNEVVYDKTKFETIHKRTE